MAISKNGLIVVLLLVTLCILETGNFIKFSSLESLLRSGEQRINREKRQATGTNYTTTYGPKTPNDTTLVSTAVSTTAIPTTAHTRLDSTTTLLTTTTGVTTTVTNTLPSTTVSNTPTVATTTVTGANTRLDSTTTLLTTTTGVTTTVTNTLPSTTVSNTPTVATTAATPANTPFTTTFTNTPTTVGPTTPTNTLPSTTVSNTPTVATTAATPANTPFPTTFTNTPTTVGLTTPANTRLDSTTTLLTTTTGVTTTVTNTLPSTTVSNTPTVATTAATPATTPFTTTFTNTPTTVGPTTPTNTLPSTTVSNTPTVATTAATPANTPFTTTFTNTPTTVGLTTPATTPFTTTFTNTPTTVGPTTPTNTLPSTTVSNTPTVATTAATPATTPFTTTFTNTPTTVGPTTPTNTLPSTTVSNTPTVATTAATPANTPFTTTFTNTPTTVGLTTPANTLPSTTVSNTPTVATTTATGANTVPSTTVSNTPTVATTAATPANTPFTTTFTNTPTTVGPTTPTNTVPSTTVSNTPTVATTAATLANTPFTTTFANTPTTVGLTTPANTTLVSTAVSTTAIPTTAHTRLDSTTTLLTTTTGVTKTVTITLLSPTVSNTPTVATTTATTANTPFTTIVTNTRTTDGDTIPTRLDSTTTLHTTSTGMPTRVTNTTPVFPTVLNSTTGAPLFDHEYIISVELNTTDVSVINLLRSILRNISYPIYINSSNSKISDIDITTVCSTNSAGFQCICEDQYRWSCDQCLLHGSCDNITNDTCGCINAIPPGGQYCQSVDHYNFTDCPPTTHSTDFPLTTPPPFVHEFLISVELHTINMSVINLLRNILTNNISYPIEINSYSNISDIDITTVCSARNASFQCICEDQHRWSCNQCLQYGPCDNITNDTCGCINAIPPGGQYCQSVDHYNFTDCPPTPPPFVQEFFISVELHTINMSVINLLRNILTNNISYPIEINSYSNISDIDITTVCSARNASFQCICEDQYRWSCNQCLQYGPCDNITNDTCGCINAIPPGGQYCQSVDHYNFTDCPPTPPPFVHEFLISVELHTINMSVINLLRNILTSNISYPIEINSYSKIFDIDITTVCSQSSFQCKCEDQYHWSCDQCLQYGPCDNITNDTCGCINAIPSVGLYCQSVDQQNKTSCPSTTTTFPPTPVTNTTTPEPPTKVTNTTTTRATTHGDTLTTPITNTTTTPNTTTTRATTPATNTTATPNTTTTRATTPVTNTTTTPNTTTTRATTPVTNTTTTPTTTRATTPVTNTTTTPNTTTTRATTPVTNTTTTPNTTTTRATTPVTNTTTTPNTTTTRATTPVTNTTTTPNTTTTRATTPVTNTTTAPNTTTTRATTTVTNTTTTPNTTKTRATTPVTNTTTTPNTTTTRATSPVTNTTTTPNTTTTRATTPVTNTTTTPNTTTTQATTPATNTTTTRATTPVTNTTTPRATTAISETTTTTTKATTTTTTKTTTAKTSTISTTAASSTTPPVLQLEMSIRFSKDYTSELGDSSSAEYRDFEAQIRPVLRDEYERLSGFINVFVTAFRPGSVIADFIVQTSQVDTEQLSVVNARLPNALQTVAPVLGSVTVIYKSPTPIKFPDVTYTGRSMTLTTSASINLGSVTQAKWKLNGQKIKASGRIQIASSATESKLTFRNVILADAGLYECNIIGSDITFVQEGFATQIKQAPNVLVPNQVNVKCSEGGAQQLRCCVQSNFIVRWFQGPTELNSEIRNGGESYCILHQYSLSGCTDSPTQELSFTCQVDNPGDVAATTRMIIFNDVATCNDLLYGTGRPGDISSIACDPGQEGSRSAICRDTGEWILLEDNCIVTEIKDLLFVSEDLVDEEVPQFAANLSKVVQEEKQEITNSSATISAIVSILSTIANVSTEVNQTVMQNVLDTVDVLVSDDARESWEVLRDNVTRNDSSDLINSMETIVDELVGEFTIKTGLILLNRTSFNNSFMAEFNSSVVIDIPNTNTNNLTITTIVFSTLDNVLPPRNSSFNSTLTDTDTNSTSVSFNVSVNAAVALIRLRKDIQNISLSFKKQNNSLTQNPQCVFWNFTLFDNFGAWDDEGCTVVSDVNNTVTCNCNHLTSFSILMATGIPESIRVALDVITYIGVGISMASLVICLIIEAYVWKALTRNSTAFMRHVCIVNTALSLLIANICFIIAASYAKNPLENPGEDHTVPLGPCTAATFFMHFFYLALFFWMLASGLLLFYRTVMVFSHMSKSGMMAIGFLFGYVCPLIIAVVTVAATAPGKGYIRENDACWLNWVKTKALLALVIPALTVVLINFLILIVIVFKMLRRGVGEVAHTDEKHALVVVARCVIILTPLFGLTWSLGVGTMISSTNEGIHIAFAFFNSLQGFFILVFGTLLDSKVRATLSKKRLVSSSGSGSKQTASTSGGASSLRGKKWFQKLRGKRYIYRVSDTANSSSNSNSHESYSNI
ncbi:uncharacterized protein LOC144039350 isoform X2 [Vanacampus margaritifer]